MRKIEARQPVIRFDGNAAFGLGDIRIQSAVGVGSRVIIAKSDERANLNGAGASVSQQFILNDDSVLAIDHEHAFLDLNARRPHR